MMSQEPPPPDKRRGPAVRQTAARFAQRLEPTVVGKVWSRLLEVEFVDRSVALAAKAFVSFLPLLVLVAAMFPDDVRGGIVSVFADRFGISGGAFDMVRQAFADPSQTKSASGLVGALITLAFAVSFTTALQRVFLRAWRRPPGGGAKNKGRGAVWVGALVLLMIVLSLIRSLVPGSSGPL